MIEDVRKQEKNKQRLLWGALAVLSLPATPFLVNDAIKEAAQTLWRKTKYWAEDKLGYVPKPGPVDDNLYLKPDTPLYQWAEAAANEQGINLRSITIRPESAGKSLEGAHIGFFKNKAFISFDGDPTVDDPSHVKALLAHEMGHFKAGKGQRFKEIAMTTTSAYALLAQTTLSLGVMAQSIQALPFVQNSMSSELNPLSAVMLGVGVASLAAIRATSVLTQKFKHSVEHLADLKASEIVGPADTISMLNEFEKRDLEYNETVKQSSGATPKRNWSNVSITNVGDILRHEWRMAIHHLKKPMENTHPSDSLRRDFIRKAHGLTEETPQVVSVIPSVKPTNNDKNLPF